jgi:hypothetical protein
LKAERHRIDVHTKEVTLLKRGVIVVAVLALALMLTASAYAFNGYRNTYSPSTVCSICHSTPGVVPAADLVYQAWVTSAHANSATNPTPTGGLAYNALPTSRGASCAGCHSGNYAPAKDVPVAGVYPTVVDPANPNNAFTEPDIGCSSCHYGTNQGGTFNTGADPADTAHMSPLGNLANPQICGQCHSHYATNVTPYALATPVPGGTISNAMYALGYNGLGSAATTPPWTPDSLSALLNVPTPSSSQTSLPFWSGGQSELSHNGGGDEYVEWAETLGQTVNGAPVTSHANALATLQAMMPDPSNPSAPANSFLNSCLQCHSTDYRIDAAAGQATPTIATAKYGITCVACHDPHSAPQQANGQPVAGTNTAMWSAANPQLATSESTLCIQCHTGQIQAPMAVAGVTHYATFPAGQEVHNATKEMMGGYGAINGIATSSSSQPTPLIGQASVHKAADCVECHMATTGWDTHSGTASGANHVFAIITPSEAASQTTSFNVTVNGVSAPQTMPESSCSACHANSKNPLAQQMQGAMDSIQSGMQDAINAVATQLALDANRMGYPWLNAAGAVVGPAHTPNARPASADNTQTIAGALSSINNMPQSALTADDLNFQWAYTNMTFASSEGSDGIHNPNYAPKVINQALAQAYAVSAGKASLTVTFKTSATSVVHGRYVQFRVWVKPAASGSVTIQMQKGSTWVTFATLTTNSSGFVSKALKLSSIGTFNFRATVAATAATAVGSSSTVRIVVKK